MRNAYVALAWVLLASASCQSETNQNVADTDPGVQTADWDRFVDRFIEDFFVAHPTAAVVAGRHEFDGLLPDWSREGIAREISRLTAQRDAALEFDDESLSDTQRFQKYYLISRIRRDLFWLDEAGWPFRNPAFYFDWMLDSIDPSVYVTLTYAPPEERMVAITRLLGNLPEAVSHISDNLSGPLPRTYIDYGVASFGGMADYFRNELGAAFSDVLDAELVATFDDAREQAAVAMAGLADGLEAQRSEATEDYALGASMFSRMLQETEMVDLPLAELKRIGEADLARNTKALHAACEAYAPGEEIPACFATMAGNKPVAGAVQGARDQLAMLRDHVVAEDLTTIPSDEEARVEEAPPYARSNFAYINIPGPYEKGQPAIYYIAPPDPSWSEEVQRDYIPGRSDLMFTSVHEVWPGHFLNFLHAKTSDWVFGRLFVGYAFAEGWAHYTEELMWETGLGDGNLEVHIGQLSNALLRNIRYLCAIGLHSGELSVEECQQKFQVEGFQDEGTARQQAARGTYDPAYLNYTLGKLMIRQLRDDWSRDRGGREVWKKFHDDFLAFGGPPIPMVRGAMLGTEAEAVLYGGISED